MIKPSTETLADYLKDKDVSSLRINILELSIENPLKTNMMYYNKFANAYQKGVEDSLSSLFLTIFLKQQSVTAFKVYSIKFVQ